MDTSPGSLLRKFWPDYTFDKLFSMLKAFPKLFLKAEQIKNNIG